MSANPFNLFDKVSKDVTVEKFTTNILYYDEKINKCRIYDENNLKWNKIECAMFLSLNDILNQIMAKEKLLHTPLIKIIYESGLWGVIFTPEEDDWIVHGVTKGYA